MQLMRSRSRNAAAVQRHALGEGQANKESRARALLHGGNQWCCGRPRLSYENQSERESEKAAVNTAERALMVGAIK